MSWFWPVTEALIFVAAFTVTFAVGYRLGYREGVRYGKLQSSWEQKHRGPRRAG